MVKNEIIGSSRVSLDRVVGDRTSAESELIELLKSAEQSEVAAASLRERAAEAIANADQAERAALEAWNAFHRALQERVQGETPLSNSELGRVLITNNGMAPVGERGQDDPLSAGVRRTR